MRIALACLTAFALDMGRVRADDRAWAVEHALAPQRVEGELVEAWPRAPQIESARVAVGVPWIWRERRTFGGGSTVCVVDSGADAMHRDLRDARGRTRIAYLLDFEGEPRGVHPRLEAYGGAVWSADELDQAIEDGLPFPTDRHGHGTAMASIAVGDDASTRLEPGPLAGMAPRARLVVVRAIREGTFGATDEDLARGVEFCLDSEVADPERLVVLIALGGHDGAHDGRGPLERVIARAAARVPVVVAVGNDGERAVHASARWVGGAPVRFTLRIPAPRIAEPVVAVSLRGAREVRVGRTVSELAASPWVRAGRVGEVEVIARRDGSHLLVWQGAFSGGAYAIEVRGHAVDSIDAWVAEARVGETFAPVEFIGATARAEHTVRIPATADGVLAVGAQLHEASHGSLMLTATRDGGAAFSSLGPRVDGAPAPTLVAPGGWVSAALSHDLVVDDTTNLFGGSSAELERRRLGTDRILVAGTSVAAAVAAGALALVRSIESSPEDVPHTIASVEPGPHAWTPRLGAGLLRADRLAQGLFGETRFGCTREDASPGHTVFALAIGGEAGQTVTTVGSSTYTLRWRDGFGAIPVELPTEAWQSFVLTTESGELCRVIAAHDGIAPLARGGGCAVGGGRGVHLGALVALSLLLARRRSGRFAPTALARRDRSPHGR